MHYFNFIEKIIIFFFNFVIFVFLTLFMESGRYRCFYFRNLIILFIHVLFRSWFTLIISVNKILIVIFLVLFFNCQRIVKNHWKTIGNIQIISFLLFIAFLILKRNKLFRLIFWKFLGYQILLFYILAFSYQLFILVILHLLTLSKF
jgi:hypothetical protein